jgi:hypothetical protein
MIPGGFYPKSYREPRYADRDSFGYEWCGGIWEIGKMGEMGRVGEEKEMGKIDVGRWGRGGKI